MYNSSWTIHYTFNGRQGELRMYYNVPIINGMTVDMTDEYYLKDLYRKAKIEIAHRHHTKHLDKIAITQAEWDEDLGYEDFKNWLHTKYIEDTYPHWPRQYDEEYGVYV